MTGHCVDFFRHSPNIGKFGANSGEFENLIPRRIFVVSQLQSILGSAYYKMRELIAI